MVEVIKRWARFAITLQAAYATLWRGISSALLSERNASLIRPDRWLWRTGLNRRGLGCRTLETDLRPRDFFLVFRHVHMVEEIRDLADAVDEVRRTQGQRALHLQETG
jgi:hypothetical protein